MNIDGQGEHRIVDEDGSEGQDDGEEQDGDQDYMEDPNDDRRQGESPPLGEGEEDGDYGMDGEEDDEVAEADQQV